MALDYNWHNFEIKCRPTSMSQTLAKFRWSSIALNCEIHMFRTIHATGHGVAFRPCYSEIHTIQRIP